MSTIHPAYPFSAEDDSKALRKAMKGLLADGAAIIDIVCARSSQQRQEILKSYKQVFGRNLIEDFKSELGGNFKNVVVGLMTPLDDYLAQSVNKAIQGIGTDEDALIEIVCTRDNAQINAIKETFKKLYGKCMEEEVADDLSGDLKCIIMALLNAERPEQTKVNTEKARKEAQELFDAGCKKWVSDKEVFISVFCSNSFEQLKATFEEYQKLAGHDILTAIEKGMSGHFKEAMLAIVKSMYNIPLYYAERLFKSMVGVGTDDATLVRIIVSRCEVDLADIRKEYLRVYERTLEHDIKDDTSGDYQKSLLKITGGNKEKKMYT